MPHEARKTTGRGLADGPGPLGPKTLTGQGAAIDTLAFQIRFAFAFFAALAGSGLKRATKPLDPVSGKP